MFLGDNGVAETLRGKVLFIQFRQNAIGVEEPMNCYAVGICDKDDENYLTMTYWVCEEDENSEFFVILKSSIIEFHELSNPNVITDWEALSEAN